MNFSERWKKATQTPSALRASSNGTKPGEATPRRRSWGRPVVAGLLIAVIVLGGVAAFEEQHVVQLQASYNAISADDAAMRAAAQSRSTTTSTSTLTLTSTSTSTLTTTSTLGSTCIPPAFAFGTNNNYTIDYIRFLQLGVELNATFSESENGGNLSNSTFHYVWWGGNEWNITVSNDQGANSTITLLNPVSFVDKGLALTVESDGQILQGAPAEALFDSYMNAFHLEEFIRGNLGIFTNSQYFLQSNSTTYTPKALPELVNECGIVAWITNSTLQMGDLVGFGPSVPKFIHFEGDVISNGVVTNEDYTYRMTSSICC